MVFNVLKNGLWWVTCTKEGPIYEGWEIYVKPTGHICPCVYEVKRGRPIHDTMVHPNS
ncbi:hypothetical protein HanIR_Chr05g0249121 [Helianthus annuus]|nr:hypothetical protein HanIR_Chr05g0249121 [Helianthus annuus]